ncbi:hypothetical protein VKT23_004475 [Stygiomarasmius scandens]|uniref:Uncharacterized protein n=1 Tax=Marasmiellus scandens TaxID=2682957 RepID=A0ABR1JYJ6_9AGAR
MSPVYSGSMLCASCHTELHNKIRLTREVPDLITFRADRLQNVRNGPGGDWGVECVISKFGQCLSAYTTSYDKGQRGHSEWTRHHGVPFCYTHQVNMLQLGQQATDHFKTPEELRAWVKLRVDEVNEGVFKSFEAAVGAPPCTHGFVYKIR